jgi:4-hydroxybenzoate polyprenyltransferase
MRVLDVMRSLNTLRFSETALLQGTPFFGLALGCAHWTRTGSSVALLLLGSFLLTNGVFVLNDIADLDHDSDVLEKQPRVARLQRLGMGRLGGIAALGGIGGVVLIAQLDARAALYAVGVLLAGILYSVRPFRFKGRPVLSTLIHLFGGVLHFMVGYSLGVGPFQRGIMIGAFFAGVFVAGSLVQESRDYEGDIRTGVTTNASRFGRRPTLLAGLGLFVLMPLYAALLAYLGIAPPAFTAAVPSIAVVLLASRGLWSGSLDTATIVRFQAAYRVVYAALGAYWLVALA